ncbi:meiosis-specific protein PAIR3 isoform X2 [Setaria viridis]
MSPHASEILANCGRPERVQNSFPPDSRKFQIRAALCPSPSQRFRFSTGHWRTGPFPLRASGARETWRGGGEAKVSLPHGAAARIGRRDSAYRIGHLRPETSSVGARRVAFTCLRGVAVDRNAKVHHSYFCILLSLNSEAAPMEAELQNIHKAASSDYWSLSSNQYPSGKFAKVSVGITIPRAGSVSRVKDATPAFDRNLSQGTDGISRPPKDDNASLQVSQEAAKNDGSAKGAPEAGSDMKVSLSQPDDNTHEQTGTFSFGTRREQVSSIDKLETPEFVSSQRKRNLESADKSKPNSEMLRMKLWEILGGTSQNKQAVASPNPDNFETPDQPKSQTVKAPSSGNKEVFTSPFPDNIKTPDPLNRQTVNFSRCKPSLDPIESDSDSPKVVEIKPVTRSLGRKKAPAASKKQSRSAKKPLSTFCSTPKKKMLDNVFTFNDKCTPKTVVKHAIGDSGSLRNLRSSNRKAKVEAQKIHYSDRISDKTTQDDKEGKLSSRNTPSDNKVEKATSFSSLSRTGKTAESCSRSPKRGRRPDVMPKVGPRKMQFSENLLAKTRNDEQNKLYSPRKISLKSKENDSSTSPLKKSDRIPCGHTAAENNFNSPPSGAANPSPEPKIYPWDHDVSPEITGKFGQNVASPWTDRFRDTPDDYPSPTLAPKDEMDKTTELPGSESPASSEERETSRQSSLSPPSPTEDEGTKSSKPSFAKGNKSHKWLSDIDGPDKSHIEHVGRKSNLNEDRMRKRRLSSATAFASSGTQETIISEKEQEQYPENYLTRAFDQLVVVLGRFQTKIKSETSKKSSEILAATGEIIRQQLEGVEVQMQADVDKLVNVGKSKRKRLESTFEEQQEKLRILHEKFKEEVNKQLLDCRTSLEDFESYHAELKGVADKQKSSHKKLLVNAEKTVGAQLNDAEVKIAEVQKRARKRMSGLKYVLKELIAETAD